MDADAVVGPFTGEYRFLSNYSPATVLLDGATYPTVEHAYAAAKTLDSADRERIRTIEHPGEARRLIASMTLRADWLSIRRRVMAELVAQKFGDPDLRQRLLATGTRPIVELNWWHDNFWGDCRCKKEDCRPPGENHLGRILMDVRAGLTSLELGAAAQARDGFGEQGTVRKLLARRWELHRSRDGPAGLRPRK